MSHDELKDKIIKAGYEAVEELIKVAKEGIIKKDLDDDIAADRLKNAAATKKLAIFDAFEILQRLEQEKEEMLLSKNGTKKVESKRGFAERRST